MHSSQDGSDIVADRCIIGGSAIIADKEVPLQWRAVVRDCGVYLASLVVLIIMLLDGKISQVIPPPAPGVSNEGRSSPLLALAPATSWPWVPAWGRWNRLVEAVKTRKKRGKTGNKWARYSLRSVKEGS